MSEVIYAEVTSDGSFRLPSREGMRDYKPATKVVKELSTVSTERRPSSRRG